MHEDYNNINWNNFKHIAIVGLPRTGKTSLIYYILEKIGNKNIYFFKHPIPQLIIRLGFKNIKKLGHIERLKDCVLVIDEAHLSIPIAAKKANQVMISLMSLSSQRNIKLIIATSDTRYFTRSIESYIDAYVIKNIDYNNVKNGSRIKRIIEENCYISPDGFSLEPHEFIFDTNVFEFKHLNRRHTFKEPRIFNDKLSRPYYFNEK